MGIRERVLSLGMSRRSSVVWTSSRRSRETRSKFKAGILGWPQAATCGADGDDLGAHHQDAGFRATNSMTVSETAARGEACPVRRRR